MSSLRVYVVCLLLAVAYGFTVRDVCPEKDNPLCSMVLSESTKKDCYLHGTSIDCCNTCRSLAATDMPKNCLYGDLSNGVTSRGRFFACNVITPDTCKYCTAPYHARENCCETCETVCGPQTQSAGQEKSLDKLLLALRGMLEQ